MIIPLNIWLVLIAALCLAGFALAIFKYKDTLHPLAFLMPMAAFIYVYMPLDATCQMMLNNSFSHAQIGFVQMINFLSLAALIIGCYYGSERPPTRRRITTGVSIKTVSAPGEAERITQIGMMLGVVASLIFWVNIYFQGGLIATFSGVKGGSLAADSGYFRDPAFWAVSAALLLLLGAAKLKARFWHYFGVAVFMIPLFLQGILGSHRGPTFMGLVSIGAGWYLTRGKRPSLVTLLVGSGAIGFLLLCLVTFRDDIYIGSNLLSKLSLKSATEAVDAKLSKEDYGNEAFYGANVILSAREKDRHYWGQRFATIVFIRPIPKQLWPNKYADVGMADYEFNVGLGSADQLIADVPPGAATGFVADIYLEFAWGGLIVCGLIGWYYGRCWRTACASDSFGIINYGCLAAFSIFFVAQTMEAILSRYLVVIVPTAILWRIFVSQPQFQSVPKKTSKRRNRHVDSQSDHPAPPAV